MKLADRKRLFLLFAVLAVLIWETLWQARSPDQPKYDGKPLSVWLNELSTLGDSRRADPNTASAHAVRAIGTNAIPWLLSEIKRKGNPFAWRVNRVLDKQRFIKYRLPDGSQRRRRAVIGFYALGPLAEHSIPDLLSLLETDYDVVPFALAGMGTPALPALQQCLTNTRTYATSEGSYTLIPGITIGCINNAIVSGRISKREAVIFLPAIRDCAKSTNRYPAECATDFLRDWHLSLCADADQYEIFKSWK